MTKPELEQARTDGNVKEVKEDKVSDFQLPTTSEEAFSLEDFIPILVSLLTPRRHLTAVPTFVPKNFVDSIQFYDDGVARRLYVYFNSTWSYCTLT
jgi:hypothetical protein